MPELREPEPPILTPRASISCFDDQKIIPAVTKAFLVGGGEAAHFGSSRSHGDPSPPPTRKAISGTEHAALESP